MELIQILCNWRELRCIYKKLLLKIIFYALNASLKPITKLISNWEYNFYELATNLRITRIFIIGY